MNHNGSRYHAKTDLGKDGILSPERQLGEPTSSKTNSPACHRTKQGNPCSTNRMPLNVYENNKTNHLHCLTTAIINHILLHKFQNSASTYKPHNKHTKQIGALDIIKSSNDEQRKHLVTRHLKLTRREVIAAMTPTN